MNKEEHKTSDVEEILNIKDLVVDYETEDGIIHAVNGVSLTLGKERTLGLVGETGAGKTTTALSVLNLIPNPPGVIKNGEILLNGKDVLKMTEKELEAMRGSDVAMIFQDPMTALNPVDTVGQQIAETILLHNEGISKKEAMKRAGEMLEVVGIPASRASEYPHQFSGGMKQRVVIAIGLSCNPKLLIADEPTTALDVTIQAQILDIMQNLKKQYQTSMIMITHDLGIVAKVCDEVAVMYAGRIVEYGSRYLQAHQASLHRGSVRFPAQHQRAFGASEPDSGSGSRSHGCAARLRLCSPLPLRNGSLQNGGSGASLHGERPLCRLQRLRRPELQNPERRESRWLRNCSRSST